MPLTIGTVKKIGVVAAIVVAFRKLREEKRRLNKMLASAKIACSNFPRQERTACLRKNLKQYYSNLAKSELNAARQIQRKLNELDPIRKKFYSAKLKNLLDKAKLHQKAAALAMNPNVKLHKIISIAKKQVNIDSV